jgi:hypothetical protein
MLTIEPLYRLIHSLTKAEKRYFTLTAELQKGKKEYMQLFKLLEASPKFDEGLIKTLKDKYQDSTIEPARKHLYRVIMKSLRQFENGKEVETKLSNLLQDARILYNKGLIDASFHLLEKVKEIALNHEKFFFFLLAAKQELNYLVRSQFLALDENRLVEKQAKFREILELQLGAAQHSMLYQVLLFRYWKNGVVRSQKQVVSLNDLLLEEHQLLSGQRRKSFESQQLHLQFQSVYFFISGNPEGSLNVYRDLDSLFRRNSVLWQESPLYYIQLIDGILYDLRSMDRYEEMEYYYRRLREIEVNSESMEKMLNAILLSHQLNSYSDQNQFKEGKALLLLKANEIEGNLEYLPIQLQAEIQLAVARIYFGNKEYSPVLKIVNSVLNKISGATSITHSSFIVFHLLNIQVNVVLKNSDYLYYALRSLERRLKNSRSLYGVEELMLIIGKRWLSNKSLNDLQDRVKALEDNPFERYFIKTLFIKSWLAQTLTPGGIVRKA